VDDRRVHRVDTASPAEVSLPTVDRWVGRHEQAGIAGLIDRSHAAPWEQGVAARILAQTWQSPPTDTGLSHPQDLAVGVLAGECGCGADAQRSADARLCGP
jgi:hypothetical protein